MFRDAVVQYNVDSGPVIDHLNLTVHGGETIAFVGASGAGKSTLVNPIAPLRGPAGRCGAAGWPRPARLGSASPAGQFAFVSQHVVMLNDSIAANVALGLELDPRQGAQALRAANLEAMVDARGNGHRGGAQRHAALRVGQRQRLAIARARCTRTPHPDSG